MNQEMNDLLICKYEKCQKYLLNPIILPCSNHICKSHFDELTLDEEINILKCFVCNEDHKIPENGFIMNTSLTKLINLNWHLHENRKKVAELVSKLKDDFKSYEALVQDPDKFIFEYISSVRNQIDLKREQLIKEINDLSDEMLNELKQYEEDCKEYLLDSTELNEQHKEYLSQISTQLFNLNEELRLPKIENERIDELLNQSNQFLNEINRKYFDYKNNLTMNQSCCFNEFYKEAKEIFGQLWFSEFSNQDRLFNSTSFKPSMLTTSESVELLKLCEFDHRSQFYLLYQATKDGFSSKNFHSKCDRTPKTLTIIKVKDSRNVFGGFCSVTWDDFYEPKNDPKAFIFSLINKDNRPLKIKVTIPAFAIEGDTKYGPIFANDIFISNNSNKNLESFSNLGYCYENDLYRYGTNEAKNFLAGSEYFSTEEIEVYLVI